MSRVLAIAVVVAAAVLAAPLAQQQDQLPLPTFRTEANYVRVDAFPTRDGAAIADLTAADFEVLEDKVPQKIEQFERVVIRAAAGNEGRREPNTVAESRQAIQDPRARVFVLFLDGKHVTGSASRSISQTLVNALTRLIGPDDYVGLMMPPMTLRDVTFARRTVAMENLLKRDWWGKRDSMLPQDEAEEQYAYCYGTALLDAPAIGQEMILRHREQQTFDALEDLVLSIRNLREERKAVLAITNGWLIYRPSSSLTRPLGDSKNSPGAQPPGNPPIGIRGGRLTAGDPSNANPDDSAAVALRKCEIDRQSLANIDDETRLRTIIDEANRANTSFYPVDPRGLVVFDEDIVPASPVQSLTPPPTLRPEEETARLRAREDGLRRLAEGTDGTAIVGTNKIQEALRRVIDDLSSYYLLGYYSSGKLDGKFHSISVRVKRPGVTVRARRGYQAVREADLARAVDVRRTAVPAASAADVAISTAVSSAVAKIVNSARDLPLRVHVTAGWRPGADGRPEAVFWTVGEVLDRIPGSDLEAALTTAGGDVVGTARGRIAPGTTSAIVKVQPGQPVTGGEFVLRVRSQGPSGTETVSIPVTLPAASQASGAVFIRRGPSTANKEMPTADLRFRRSDRLRVEVPVAADAAVARLLDRTGKPLAVPVTAATRTDADGTRWATGELALAPLAPADYVVEIAVGDTRTMAAFRVVP